MQLDFLERESVSTIAASPVPAAPSKSSADITVSHDDEKAPSAFKTISEAADTLGIPQHVLRFWESKFTQIRPLKLRGGRRYYRPEDMDILVTIKNLLYKQGYTIKGAKKAFSGRGNPLPDKSAEVKEASASTRAYSDKQIKQLMVIRQELMVLRDALRPYVSQ